MKKLMQSFRLPHHFTNTRSITKNRSAFSGNSTRPNQNLAYNTLGAVLLSGLFYAHPVHAVNEVNGGVALTIAQENALTVPNGGDWYGFHVIGSNATDSPHTMDGYADRDSVEVGGTINLFTHSDPIRNPTYTIKVYRIGWYKGVGGRLVFTSTPQTSRLQTTPTPNPVTGIVACNWTNPYALTIGSDWTSGVYVATIVGDSRKEGKYIPFVVKKSTSTAPYLFQSSSTTWHAYNNYGGKSLYGYNSTGLVAARKISFNRPYENAGGLGTFLNWEINFLYFLEKEGIEVSYQSNTDTHNGEGLLQHKAFLSVGHDEYWSKAMRDNIENARAHGVALGFFGANVGYWQIRMEDANRTIVGYKDNSPFEDPFAIDADATNNFLITSRWREGALPTDFRQGANRPENALVGVMYAFGPRGTSVVNENMVSTQADPNIAGFAPPKHWAFAGSRVQVGEIFPTLVGYEADRVFDNGRTPAGLEILTASLIPLGAVDHESPASANYNPATPKSQTTVYYKTCTVTPCANPVSTVFATGSMQWNWGLNTSFKFPYIDPIASVQQITRNVLARMINPPAAATAAFATSRAALLADASTPKMAKASNEDSATKFAPFIIPLIQKEQKDEKGKIKHWKQNNKDKDDKGKKKDIEQ